MIIESDDYDYNYAFLKDIGGADAQSHFFVIKRKMVERIESHIIGTLEDDSDKLDDIILEIDKIKKLDKKGRKSNKKSYYN